MTTTDTPQSLEVVQVQPQSVAISQAMRVEDILAQVKLIQDVMRKVMVEKEHYGTIPGCGDKKTLLQPGAQKLCVTFRLAPEYIIQETNLERGHKEYRVICTLKTIGAGSFAGQGVGVCSTMESKYRFHGGARKCPECGKEAIIKGKQEYGGGWLCFKKKDGCGAKWPDGAKEIEGQSVDKVETENPADCFNTVLKMAKKRAYVDATITATAASDIFTQDVGDDETPSVKEEYIPPISSAQAMEAADDNPCFDAVGSSTPEPPKKIPPAPSADLKIGPKYRMQVLNRLKATPGQDNCNLVGDWLRFKGWITAHQTPLDFPLDQLPRNADDFTELTEAIQRFEVSRREQEAQP